MVALVRDRGEQTVKGLTAAEFRTWWPKNFEPGQHLAMVGPTGEGKTTASVELLRPRRYALALDPKGGDPTLDRLRWPRLERWPPPRAFWSDVEEGKPMRRIVGQVCHRMDQYPALAAQLRRCLDDVFTAGGFTLYVDELEVLARFMKLSAQLELFLIAARRKGISVMSAYQRPSWVPTSASNQTTWFGTFFTRDTDVVARLGEMAGRPRRQMIGMVRGLGSLEYSMLLFSRRPRDPVIATRLPYVG